MRQQMKMPILGCSSFAPFHSLHICISAAWIRGHYCIPISPLPQALYLSRISPLVLSHPDVKHNSVPLFLKLLLIYWHRNK